MGIKSRMKVVLLKRFGVEIKRIEKRIVTLNPTQRSKGNVLLSYVIAPFLLRDDEEIPISHTNFWESVQIAQTFLDMGFSVDIVNYDDQYFVPEKLYTCFVGSRYGFDRIAKELNKDCVKIVHLTVAHWLFNNGAQFSRLSEVKAKKGVAVLPRKMIEVNQAIECADYATILGNDFTIGTYTYANKKIFPIPISTPVEYPWFEKKDFDACRKNYIWFGSQGLAHKGLDLVLEAFAELPEFNLTVCGPVSDEPDFEKAYYDELYNKPNITTVGWVDIAGDRFREITRNSLGLVYPSCSEGQSGGVVTCLHASLIPIVSYESGVDIDEKMGVLLDHCSVQEIKNSLQEVSSLPTDKLQSMARCSWEYARQNNTKDRFAAQFKSAILQIFKESAQADP